MSLHFHVEDLRVSPSLGHKNSDQTTNRIVNYIKSHIKLYKSPSVEDAPVEVLSVLLRHSGLMYKRAWGSSINMTVLPKLWDMEQSNERSWSAHKCFPCWSIISQPFPKRAELVPPGTVPALPPVTKTISFPVDSPFRKLQGKLAAQHRRCPQANLEREAQAVPVLPPSARAWSAGLITGTVSLLVTSASYSTGSIWKSK